MLPPSRFLKPTMPAAAVMAMASSVKQLFVKRIVEAFLGKEEAEAGMSRWRTRVGLQGRCPGPRKEVLLATRLGLEHKDKTRVFDDFLGEGLNSSAGLREKLVVQSIDELAANLLSSSIRQAAS